MTAGPLAVETPGEGWYIDGVYLSDLGTLLEPRDGWDDVAPARGDNSTALGYDGDQWREKRRAVGTKTISLGIHGADWDGLQWLVPATGSAQRALYEANLDALLRLVGVEHRPLMVERVYPGGARRRATCEVTGAITPAATGNSYGQIEVPLIVLSATWEDVEELTTRLPYDETGPAQQTVEVYALRGQTASCGDAEVTVFGPCSSVAVTDARTGRGFTYPDTLSPSDVLVVQPDGKFGATLNGGSVITAVEFTGSQLLRISAAPSASEGPSVVLNAPSAASGFRVVVRSRGKYLR